MPIETALSARPPEARTYILALTLRNGVEGYFTGHVEPDEEGRIVPGIAVSLAAHEGAAAQLLDHAWRGPIFAAVRLQAMLKNFGIAGIEIAIVEYCPAAGGAT